MYICVFLNQMLDSFKNFRDNFWIWNMDVVLVGCRTAPCLHTHTVQRTHTRPRPSSRLFRYIVVYFIRRSDTGEPFDSVLTRTFYKATTMRRCSLGAGNNYSYRNRF